MSVLSKHFNAQINQASPLRSDLVRRVKVDENGIEHVCFETFDYDNFQRSLGTVEDWSLQKLTKAGINPDFHIHTTAPTRLEVEEQVISISASADELFHESEVEVATEPDPEINFN